MKKAGKAGLSNQGKHVRRQADAGAGTPSAPTRISEGSTLSAGAGCAESMRSMNCTSATATCSPLHSPPGTYHFCTQLSAPSAANTASLGLHGATLPSWMPAAIMLRRCETCPADLDEQLLADLKEWRHGGAEMRAVAHYDESGTIDAYALWRPLRRWSDGGPASEVRVIEHVAANPQAYLALWAYLWSIDLTKTVHIHFAAVDEPLVHAVSDPERLNARVGDGLWVRVLDVPAAFAARRYATDIDLVLEVTDAAIAANAGRWRLTGSPTGATCVATGDEPDLTCDVRALGAVYLGGTALATLAGTGQVIEHTPGALARADAALRWHPGPSSQEVF